MNRSAKSDTSLERNNLQDSFTRLKMVSTSSVSPSSSASRISRSMILLNFLVNEFRVLGIGLRLFQAHQVLDCAMKIVGEVKPVYAPQACPGFFGLFMESRDQ